MIVTKYFVGDSDGQTQRSQASVYPDALRIIVRDCAGQENLARMGLNDDWSETLNPSNGFDHQTLQAAHDILAATWRFRHASSFRQRWHQSADIPPDLPIWDMIEPGRPADWLRDLEAETKSWRQGGFGLEVSVSYQRNPRLADLVVRILENQKTPVGYRAQMQLAWELVNRFKDVPWDQLWLSSVKSDYEALL